MPGRWLARAVVLASLLGGAHAAAIDLPQPRWATSDVEQLVEAIDQSQSEGLRPQDYDIEALISGLMAGESNLDAIADRAALALAHDFFEGSASADARRDWHIVRPPMDYRGWLNQALATHSIAASFRSLLPETKAYLQLRTALADCRNKIGDCHVFEINLDRWRALPRDLGTRYLWVNVPAFRLDLVEDGRVVSSHRIIVGKPNRRTPMFKAAVTGVTLNPWWNVPCSIVDESIGKLLRRHPKEAARRGFVATRGAGGRLVVRQRPGPDNALGQVKLEMPNPYNVYIHDTPSRDLFSRDTRALSHGCIRTEDPQGLARALLGARREPEIQLTLITGQTKTLRLDSPVPVYVVYMTAEPDPTIGDKLLVHKDVYDRDGDRL
jgi:murein L,D-transpeptidase YcbB/YkuD